MKKDLELIKFNLTQEMSLELIKFNKLKKEYIELKTLYNENKNDNLLLKLEELEKKLNNSKIKFINQFRQNNRKEIIEYLNIRDQL